MLMHNAIARGSAAPDGLAKAALARPIAEGIMGSRLAARNGFGGLDEHRLKALLEESFGKSLAPGYFGQPAERVILEEDYLGLAVMKRVSGVPYLDKFAVSPEARGRGLGRQIWERLKEDYNSFIWRASSGNPINCWYEKNSAGSERIGKWIVFWQGMETHAASAMAPLVASIPETFKG
jgi:acetylglutamate synthase